jgi:hypothetical protein
LLLLELAQKPGSTYSAIYTVAEAARLCVLSQGRVRRWAKGYSFRRGTEIRNSPPVVRTSHRVGERGAIGLDFLDLIEIRYVKAFIEAGVSWQVLRAAHARAAAMLHAEHPFATKKFYTDGQTILAKLAEPPLLDIMRNQFVFSRILDRYLAGGEGLDFDKQDLALRWWPMGRKGLVVIDSERSFGQPIVSIEGVPTAVLNRAYLAESGSVDEEQPGEEWTPDGPKPARVIRFELPTAEPKRRFERLAIGRVAGWFGVEKRSVRAAIEYESDFLDAA